MEEVAALVVAARKDSPVEVVVVEDRSKLGTGSVLILSVRTFFWRNAYNQCNIPKPYGPGRGPGCAHTGVTMEMIIVVAEEALIEVVIGAMEGVLGIPRVPKWQGQRQLWPWQDGFQG